MPVYLTPPPSNPLVRLLAGLVAVLTLVGAFMIGIVALAVGAGLMLVLGVATAARIWWLRRRLARQGGAGAPPGDALEGEFTVVSRRRDPPT